MNKADTIRFRNENAQLVRMSNRNHRNCVRFSSNETREHLAKKVELCHDLKKKKMEFITEAIFQNGARCDILSLDDGVVYEVLKSEKIEQAKKKEDYYPQELEIIFVKI